MSSSHRIDSVTWLRLSSRWMLDQSGPTQGPRFVPASSNKLASSAASVSPSRSGQPRLTSSKRLIVVRTVVSAASVSSHQAEYGTLPPSHRTCSAHKKGAATGPPLSMIIVFSSPSCGLLCLAFPGSRKEAMKSLPSSEAREASSSAISSRRFARAFATSFSTSARHSLHSSQSNQI
jgi:hypothetical protein